MICTRREQWDAVVDQLAQRLQTSDAENTTVTRGGGAPDKGQTLYYVYDATAADELVQACMLAIVANAPSRDVRFCAENLIIRGFCHAGHVRLPEVYPCACHVHATWDKVRQVCTLSEATRGAAVGPSTSAQLFEVP